MPPKGKAAKGADVLQQKSPAEFFAENKNIAGFDNVSLACANRLDRQLLFSSCIFSHLPLVTHILFHHCCSLVNVYTLLSVN